MDIDNYIRHLELQNKGLKNKINAIEKTNTSMNFKKQRIKDRNTFDYVVEKREQIKSNNKELEFLRKLKGAIIDEEIKQNNGSKVR